MNDEFIEKLLDRIIADPKVSLSQHAGELNVSVNTVRRVVTESGFKSFIRKKHQLITEVARERRLVRAKKLLTWLKNKLTSIVRIFSDKKIFTVDQFHSRCNDRCDRC